MDWNLKAASWDLTELNEAGLPNIETVDTNGSSRFGFGLLNRSKGEFGFDLKLGHVGNSGAESSSGATGGGVSKTASYAASGPSKRARAINNGTQTASCLVDGCNSDLSNCRDYHRRHKVCELHSKTPVVTIGGHKQRFCQQCSRFHSLEEFDEGKRSCRKRLDGHNRRRRKPQPVPLTPSATFLSNYQGRQLLPLSTSSHVYPSSGVVSPGWNGRMQQVHLVNNKQELYQGSSETTVGSYNKEGNKEEITYLPRNPDPSSSLEASASVCHTLLSTTGRPVSVEESPPCALSLLSSPVQTHTHTHTHTPMSLVHPLGLTLHDDHTLDLSVATTVLLNNPTHDSHPSLFNIASDVSHPSQPPPSLPFHWD